MKQRYGFVIEWHEQDHFGAPERTTYSSKIILAESFEKAKEMMEKRYPGRIVESLAMDNKDNEVRIENKDN